MGNYKDTWMQAAATSAQGALGIGIQRLGAKYDRKQQLKTQEAMMGLQMKGEKEMMAEQQRLALEMWKQTGVQGQMEQLKAAGLNPGLIYGMGGAGGATTGPGGSPAVTGGQANYVDTTGMGMQMGMSIAQQRLMNSQADNLDADTAQKTGVGKEKIQAEIMDITQGIQNKQAQQKLTEVQTEIQQIQKRIATATEQEAKDLVVAQLGKAEQEVMQLEVKTFIDRATQNDIIDTIKAELAGAYLKNALTRAQTKTEKGQPAVQSAQIDLMMKQGTDILRKAVQKWRELEMTGKEMDIQEQKELREEMKTIAIPENIIDDIINGIILKKVLTPEAQKPQQKDWRFYKKSDNIENQLQRRKR